MKISLLEPLGVEKIVITKLSQPLIENGHEFIYYDTKTTDPEELKSRSKDSDIIMIANNPYPKEVIESTKNLKMLSVAFTGIDHIDCDACKRKDITVCNASGYSDQSVAELVIGMSISAMRNIIKSNEIVRKGGTNAEIGGKEICGKTVGIIGLGRIGLLCAKLFLAFGAKVIAYNRSENPKAKEMGIEYKSLNEVLSKSDIVSLNLPLNKETKGFIGKKEIALMRPNTIFINCARGAIVDNTALARALASNKLGFACIDVFDNEPPLDSNYPLLSSPNTLLTPHQAFISEESMMRRAEIVFNNVYSYINGNPINVCNL